MKKITALFLLLAVLFSLCAFPAAAETTEAAPTPSVTVPENTDEQIALLYGQFKRFMKDESDARWSFTVTDLNCNDRLELLAGLIQGNGRFTTIKAWQLNEKKDDLDEISIPIAEGDSFPDIIVDASDTFHDPDSGCWYYMFNDHVTASGKEIYANKCAISLYENELRFFTYAFQHSQWIDGRMVVTFTDRNGNTITPEEYIAADRGIFSDMEHSSTHFDWFLGSDVTGIGRLSDSFSVFVGLKQPPREETPDAEPSPTPAPDSPSAFLVITKNPTDEYRYEGDSAWFVANAANWTSANWTFVDPYGNECSWQSFQNRFYWSKVSGGNSTTVTISNLDTDMSGWGAYCTFYGSGQIASTATAYFHVSYAPQPTPVPTPVPTVGPVYGQMNGYVSDYLMSTVTITLENGSSVQLLKDICTIDGNLSYGCDATVYYMNYPSRDNITSCYIQGTHDPEPPSGGSMGATFIGATMNTVGFRLDNGGTVNVSRDICTNYGSPRNGDSATVYYSGYAPDDYNVYHVDVYGRLYDDGPDTSDSDYGPWLDADRGGVFYDPGVNAGAFGGDVFIVPGG